MQDSNPVIGNTHRFLTVGQEQQIQLLGISA